MGEIGKNNPPTLRNLGLTPEELWPELDEALKNGRPPDERMFHPKKSPRKSKKNINPAENP